MTIATPATNAHEVKLAPGDEVVACLASGIFVRTKVVAYVQMARITVADAIPNARYLIRFVTPSAGQIAGKEVTVAAKEKTVETLEKKLAQTTDARSRQTIIEQINLTRSEIHTLLYGNSTGVGLYAQMRAAAELAVQIGNLIAEYRDIQAGQASIEKTFVDAMGDLLLRDGYWNDPNYVKGQELALYSDALDMIGAVSKPMVTYRVGFLDLSGQAPY